jgi:hypothetical protein
MRTLLAISVIALPIPAAIAGCGGDDSDVDPEAVIDETFNNEETVSSGNLSLSLGGSAEGAQSGSFEASLEGPFQGDPDNPAAIPQLDWTGSVTGEGAGQSISFEGGVTVTEDNAYVEYGGNAYELGSETFNQFKEMAESAASQQQQSEDLSFGEAFRQGCEQSIEAQGGDPAACDIDFNAWLSDPTSEGTEDIEGTETDHVAGSVNVETMLNDLIELGASTGQALPPGTEDQVGQIADATDVTFDLYSGTDDRILRGLDFAFSVDPSAIPDAEAAGVENLEVTFSMRLGGVNEEQTIEGPSDAQPIDQLLKDLGVDPGSLGGLGGLGGGLPGGLGGGVPGAGGGGGGSTGDPYLDCIAEAQTPDEITACADEL